MLVIWIQVVLFSTTLSFIVVKSSLAKMFAKYYKKLTWFLPDIYGTRSIQRT